MNNDNKKIYYILFNDYNEIRRVFSGLEYFFKNNYSDNFYCNKSQLYIDFPNSDTIFYFKSAQRPERLVGKKLEGAIYFDLIDKFEREVMYYVTPQVKDNNGILDIISMGRDDKTLCEILLSKI